MIIWVKLNEHYLALRDCLLARGGVEGMQLLPSQKGGIPAEMSGVDVYYSFDLVVLELTPEIETAIKGLPGFVQMGPCPDDCRGFRPPKEALVADFACPRR